MSQGEINSNVLDLLEYIIDILLNRERHEIVEKDDEPIINEIEITPKTASINRNRNGMTSNVPIPSTFIYAATPITKLPCSLKETPLHFRFDENGTLFSAVQLGLFSKCALKQLKVEFSSSKVCVIAPII